MVAIPRQSFTIRDPGLAQTPAAISAFLYLGTCSSGVCGAVSSFNDLPSAANTLGQGELAEIVTGHLSEAGGPVFAMRMFGDVAGTFGAVTKYPAATSTGTVTIGATPQDAAKAWSIDDPAGTPVYVDFTTALASAGAADVTIYPAVEVTGDQFAIGFASPFTKIFWTLSTLGTVGTTTYKYWNGTAWTALSGVGGAAAHFIAGGAVTWTMPTDWVQLSINGSAPLYFVVAEVATAYTVNPIGTSMYVDLQGPHDSYVALVEITTTGTLGTATFRYSLDNGYTYSSDITLPSGLLYDIPNTGVRLTFAVGGGPTFFVDGDVHGFSTAAPFYSTTALAAAFTSIGLNSDDFAVVVLAGRAASGSAGATIFASLSTQINTLETAHRSVRAIMDAGIDSAASVKAGFASSSSSRIMVCFTEDSSATLGKSHVTSAKPFNGYSAPRKSIVHVVAPRAAASLISTHLGRFADGTLSRCRAIGYNEEKGTDAMSVARFCTLRTWQGYPGGFYINRPNLMSSAGSDYVLWPHGRIADTAESTAHRALQRFMNTKVRVLKDGTGRIDPKDALRIEGEINAALAENLTVPLDAEGNRGHVAAVSYRIDLESDVAGTNQVVGQVAIVRDGYAEEILTTLGFAAVAV